MQKWEYLEVTCYSIIERGKPIVKTAEWIDGELQGKTTGGMFSKTMYPDFYQLAQQLGEEGWELVGIDVRGWAQSYIYKRQKI